MKAKDIPIGVTCHCERDKEGQWWIVWGADFPQDKPGRKLHPESMLLEEAYKAGIKEVAEWVWYNVVMDTDSRLLLEKKEKKWGLVRR